MAPNNLRWLTVIHQWDQRSTVSIVTMALISIYMYLWDPFTKLQQFYSNTWKLIPFEPYHQFHSHTSLKDITNLCAHTSSMFCLKESILSWFSRETSPGGRLHREHAEGVHVTLLLAGLGEDVLQSKEELVCMGQQLSHTRNAKVAWKEGF